MCRGLGGSNGATTGKVSGKFMKVHVEKHMKEASGV